MQIKNSKLKAGSFYLIGNLFNKAIAFLTIPIFTRLLTTSEYGMVSTYISWVTIVGAFIGLSLGNSIRSAYIDLKSEIDSYISAILFLSMLNFLITTAFVLLFINFASFEVDKILVLLCLIQAYMTTVINAMSVKYMMGYEYIRKTLLLALPNILVVVLSIILILQLDDMKHMGRIRAYVIVYFFVGTILLFNSMLKGKVLINIDYWKYGLKFSLPLIFHGLSVVILAQSDRAMITALRNTSETGVYSLVYNFSMIALVVTTSLESIWIPWFSQRLAIDDRKSINQISKYYLAIVTYLVIGIMLISPEVLEIMSPPEYWWGKVLIPPVVLASFFMFLYSLSVNVEYYYRSTKIIAINTVIAALLNVALNFIFIPHYGALAAAYTTVFSYAISFYVHYLAARKLDKELFSFKMYILPILILIVITITLYVFMDAYIVRWSILFIITCILFIYAIGNRKNIKMIIEI